MTLMVKRRRSASNGALRALVGVMWTLLLGSHSTGAENPTATSVPRSVLYVVRTGPHCDTLSLFSGPGYPKDIGSTTVATVRSGDVGDIIETSNQKGASWYRVRLVGDKSEGWITESCSGALLQVGGVFPGIRMILTTASGRKLSGHLRKRSRREGASADEDLGIVERDESLQFQDTELGRVNLPWRQFKSARLGAIASLISTVDGNTYKTIGILGVEKTSTEAQYGFGSYGKVGLELSLWLSTPTLEVKLGDIKDGVLERDAD